MGEGQPPPPNRGLELPAAGRARVGTVLVRTRVGLELVMATRAEPALVMGRRLMPQVCIRLGTVLGGPDTHEVAAGTELGV